ncbi:hypothetical protein HD553DRAFT_346807 [Filobasidium floriforme]|uniref:uncharacterized protein n=1 Tax=Filobasidium floriforme TaxID=5210 RepID=UPI001E8C9ECB|nr:uncharacterized protein HD553DRAFT_346807 [Filobasidium floriforme]KAH8090289.1 hypothetical protein HD553DRAFT_346807 [Filobasidium floriforme]
MEEVSEQAEAIQPGPQQVLLADSYPKDEGTGQAGSENNTEAEDDFGDINWDAPHLDITKYLIKIMDRPDNLIGRQQAKNKKHILFYLGAHLTYKIRHILKRAPFALGFNDMKGYLHKLHSLLKGDDAQERKLYVSCSPHLAALTAIIVRSRKGPPDEKQNVKQARDHPMLGKNRNFSTAFPPLQEWIALLDQELDFTIQTFPEISQLDWETRMDARDMKPAARRRIFWLDWNCLEPEYCLVFDTTPAEVFSPAGTDYDHSSLIDEHQAWILAET